MKWIVAIVMVGGCVLVDPGKDPGEACRADRDCATGTCYGGICSAGSCEGQDRDCPTNYRCLHSDGDPIFGIGDGYYCARSCDGGCPERWECDNEQACYFEGPAVTVVADPATPRAHEPVTFTVTISPDLETTFAWHFEKLDGTDVGGTAMGETCDQTFDAGDYHALVRWDTPGWGSTDGVELHVCAVAGDPCDSDAACCTGLACPAGACQ